MEKERSSLAEQVSSIVVVCEQDFKTIAFLKQSLIEMEVAQQEDGNEEEEGEDEGEDGEE